MNVHLDQLLRGMRPVLHDERVAFCELPADDGLPAVPWIGLFREAEGTTVIVPERVAADRAWPVGFRAAWITLSVESELHAVGLTAAVSRALADEGISCNIVAAVHHDHLFVPVDQGPAALAALERLERSASHVVRPG